MFLWNSPAFRWSSGCWQSDLWSLCLPKPSSTSKSLSCTPTPRAQRPVLRWGVSVLTLGMSCSSALLERPRPMGKEERWVSGGPGACPASDRKASSPASWRSGPRRPRALMHRSGPGGGAERAPGANGRGRPGPPVLVDRDNRCAQPLSWCLYQRHPSYGCPSLDAPWAFLEA